MYFLSVITFLLFIFEFRKHKHYNEVLTKKQQEVETARNKYESIDEMRNEIRLQKEKQRELNMKLPENEKDAPELIKIKLIKKIKPAFSKFGIINMEFNLEKKEQGKSMGEVSQKESVYQPTEMGMQSPSQGRESSVKPSLPLKPQPIPLKISFECKFPDLILFLDYLLNQERIISVENINIKREEKILPRQKVDMELLTYTLPKIP